MSSAPPGALVKGTAVTVHGLQSRADLNGSDGVLATAFEDGRYGVKVGQAAPLRIKADNLMPRQSSQGLHLSDNAVETIQRANVPQLAWVLTEFGPSSSEFAELALLYACVLFSPEQVGSPPIWSRDGTQNVADFLRASGHLGVLRTMDAHIDNPTVQERGVQQMMTLVTNEQSALRSTDAVNAAGGAAACVRAMRMHPSHEGVQTFGCRLLMNLSCSERIGEETGGPTAAKRAVFAAGGIEVALAAIAAFPRRDELLQPALKGCAYVVMSYAEAAQAAIAADAPRCVVKLLHEMQVGDETLGQACQLLANLCFGSTADSDSLAACALAVVGAGAIPTICAAMRARGHAAPLVDCGCVALHNLAGLGYAAACREAGAGALVDAALMLHPTLSTRVQMLADALAASPEV